ncbi:MAG: GntR family transcriptional regulator [Desulfatiglans sp.]|nr:GntR family transcriptional regulator [Desulfatiglans sp.]
MANRKSKIEKTSLDHISSVPFFIQIAETMKRRILSGQYDPGKQLFTGEELEKEFQTSNITIRKALDKLKNDGFVERRRGLGTTVSRIEETPLTFELGRSFKKLKESIQKLNTQVKVLEITTTRSSEYVQNFLSMDSEQDIWRMKRLRIFNGLPVSFNTYYTDPTSCNKISKADAEKDDILHTIEQAKKIRFHKVNQTLRSVAADLDISSALEIPYGAPVFFNETTYHPASGKALLLSQNYFRGDMFIFRTSSLL